jgi:two-component sensor histidine kinase
VDSPLAARLYNTSDGMSTNQMTGGMQSAAALTAKGELWAPSTAGVIVVKAAVEHTTQIPPLLLEEVLAGDSDTPVHIGSPDAPIEIAPGSGKLELHYTAIRLRSPERLRFRYWMEGAEPGWNQVGDRRVAYFTNLSPARYRFHVAAWDVNDPSHVVSRVFPIVLLPAYYQTWWFMLLMVALALGLAWGGYLVHVRNVRRQFQAVLDERTRLAREMHDTVIQGCVGVSALLEAASSTGESAPEVSRVMIERARDEIRTTVEDARAAVWNLRHQEDGSINEAITKLVTRVRSESGIDIEMESTGHATALDSEAERGVVFSAREALSNAVRHSGATRIVMKLRFTGEWLSIDVVDNGIGFEWHGQTPGGSRHYGLIGMKERMEKLGGSFDLDSAPGQGTRVRLRVPLPQAIINDPRRTPQSV